MLNFEQMNIEELEAFRAETQNKIAALKEQFMAAGKVLNKKLQIPELLAKKEKLEKERAEVDTRLKELEV